MHSIALKYSASIMLKLMHPCCLLILDITAPSRNAENLLMLLLVSRSFVYSESDLPEITNLCFLIAVVPFHFGFKILPHSGVARQYFITQYIALMCLFPACPPNWVNSCTALAMCSLAHHIIWSSLPMPLLYFVCVGLSNKFSDSCKTSLAALVLLDLALHLAKQSHP